MDSSNTKITIRTKKPTHPVGNNSTPPAFMTSSRKSTSSPTPFSTKDATPTVFLPASPTPHVFDPAKRLQELKDGLDPKSSFYYFYEGQHPNIRAAIKAYEEGKIPLGSTRYFLGRKIVPEAEATRANTFVWKEVCSLFYFPSFLTHSFTSLTVPKPQHAGYRHAQLVNKQAYVGRHQDSEDFHEVCSHIFSVGDLFSYFISAPTRNTPDAKFWWGRNAPKNNGVQ